MSAQENTQGPGGQLERIADGLFRFDSGYIRPRHTACFVVVEAGRAAIVDCATSASVPALLAALAHAGVARDSVEAVIATHAHLDHTGGMGALMAELPQAQLYAHPATAPHVIDPTRLEAGTRAVLGDEVVDREHDPAPVAPERVVETADAMVLPPAGRLAAVHTPGHTRDHQSLWDARTGTLVAGDAFGIAYPELDGRDGPFVIPETPPTQFDPEAMHASIDRIVALAPERVAPTHFSVLERPAAVAPELHGLVDEYIARCLAADSAETLEAGIIEAFEQALSRRGRSGETELMRRLYGFDAHLVSLGLWHWRKRQVQ